MVGVRDGTGSPDEAASAEARRCLNCGWEVERFYCPNCGQHIASHTKGVWQFIQEFLEEFLRFDSKLVRTLVPLVTKPGFLTTEWTSGKRVRYISPLKLYITISALCFLVLSISPNAALFRGAGGAAETAEHASHLSPIDALFNRGVPNLSKVDPKVLREHIFMHLPTATLILVPVTALVFSLLYIRSKRFYVEHLVFTLHYNCFCFLTYSVASIFPGMLPRQIAFFWAVGYLAFAIKHNYGQGWAKSILKFVLFGCVYLVLLVITMLGTIAFSARMAAMMQEATAMHTH